MRLFCFPYSGAGASAFFAWRGVFGADIDVVPVELPGRGRRMAEPLARRIDALAEQLIGELTPQLTGRYAFFGHSMGALLAFEMARRLARTGAGPAHLFASAHTAPQRREREVVLHTLPEAELIERLRTLNGTPDEVLHNRELRDLILPILRADFEMCDSYRFVPGEPLPSPITAYGGLGDEEVTRADLEGWGEHTAARFAVRMFPGGHFYLQTAQHDLLRVLGRDLRDTALAAAAPAR